MNTLKYKHFECFQLNIQPEKGYVEELNQNRMFQYVIAPLPLTFHLFFAFLLQRKHVLGVRLLLLKISNLVSWQYKHLLQQRKSNTRIYNLISVSQITRFRVKETRAVAAQRRRESMAKLEIIKQCLRSFRLFQLFTENNKPIFFAVLSSLKFENSLFSNKLFRCIFRSERKVYIQLNTTKVCSKLPCWNYLCCYCHKLRFFKFVESFKELFHHWGSCRFLISIRLGKTTISGWIHPLNIRKQETYS